MGVNMEEYSATITVKELEKFYQDLANHENIFYMFFTTELLFWVEKSISYIPKDVNLVLIGAGLTKDEVDWVEGNVSRPFFHIREYCDDRDVWELLFLINQKNFGWIDIDCFILNPELFYEMTMVDQKVSINCIWTCKCSNLPKQTFINTYFLFINIEVLKRIKAIGVEVSPRTYIYQKDHAIALTKSNIIQDGHKEIIKCFMPENTYPSTVKGLKFFDTLLLYQMMTEHHGYKINRVRKLDSFNYYSNEIIHVGSSSNFSTPHFNLFPDSEEFREQEKIIPYLMFSYCLLNMASDTLPKIYNLKKRYIALELYRKGIGAENVRGGLKEYLKGNGLSEETTEKLMSSVNNI
jgi:hypothetical protein